MLIPFEDILSRYNVYLMDMDAHDGHNKYILHIGAHLCEEKQMYNNAGFIDDQIVWIEANANTVKEVQTKYSNCIIYNTVASDRDDTTVDLILTNNGGSNSILELKEHHIEYPNIVETGRIKVTTTTVDTLFKTNSYDPTHVEFVTVSGQGSELSVFKGMTDVLRSVNYVYTKVYTKELYTGCPMLYDTDEYLKAVDLYRVQTQMTDSGWGEALYKRIKYFPLYWINMLGRSDRRRQMYLQFKELNISRHTRITPVPDKKPTHSCIMAHYRAIQTAHLDNEDLVMIVEDDIKLTQKSVNKIKDTLKRLPDDWECFQVHCIEPNIMQNLITDKYKNAIVKGYLMGGTCYLYNKRGMQRFMDQMGEYDPNFTLNDDAEPEEFIYRYVNTYFSIHPVIVSIETHSDLRTDTSKNVSNMYLIEEYINQNKDVETDWLDSTVVFPYNSHWFSDISMAKHALEISLGMKKVVYTYLHAGFCNRLFQYYSAWGMAKKHGLDFRVLGQQDCYQQFSLFKDRYKIYPNKDVEELFDQFYTKHFIIKDQMTHYKEMHTSGYDHINIDFNVPGTTSYILDGFFQNESYFKEYKEDISKEVLKGVREKIVWGDDDEKDLDKLVAIHVRLGDIVGFQKHFIDLGEYYERAIKHCLSVDSSLKFVLVSDDHIGNIERFYPKLTKYPKVKSDSELYDFYLMTRCRAVVCANSTFSWWAAWVNISRDKLVTIPSRWLNDRDSILKMEGSTVIDV